MAVEKVAEILIGNPAPEGSLTQTWGILQHGRGPITSDAPIFSIVEILRGNLFRPQAEKPIDMVMVKAAKQELTLGEVEDFIVRQIREQHTGEHTPGETLATISFNKHLLIQEVLKIQSPAAEQMGSVIQQIIEAGHHQNSVPAPRAA